MFAASILRAFAAEVALKAIAIKATGTCSRVHDLLQLFDELDQNARACIEQQGAPLREYRWDSMRSILADHKGDFMNWRYYVGEQQGMNPCGDDMDVALRALIAAFHELPAGK